MPYLIVKNKDKTIFEGSVDNVSCYNKKGLFDVLLDHSNFISIVQKQIILRKSGTEQLISVENGLMKVKGNQINIYIGVK